MQEYRDIYRSNKKSIKNSEITVSIIESLIFLC